MKPAMTAEKSERMKFTPRKVGREYLLDLKEDINKVIDALVEVIKTDKNIEENLNKGKEIPSAEEVLKVQKDLINRLEATTFNNLEGTTGSSNLPEGNFENLAFALSSNFKALREDVINAIKEKSNIVKIMQGETKACRVNLQKEEAESMYQRQRYEYALAEKNTLLSKCRKLEEQLEERSNKIKQLQRDGTIALWKREKQRIIEDLGSRESKLEEDLRIAKSETQAVKERLQKKITDLSNQVKLMKVERQCVKNTRIPNEEDMEANELEELKRNIFLKDRAIIIAESEIQKQQRYFAGFIQGIQRDFRLLMSRLNIDEDNYDWHQNNFHTLLENMLDAALEGTFSSFRIGLPSHYLGLNLHISEMPIKKRHESAFIRTNNSHGFDISGLSLGPSLVKWREGKQSGPPDPEELLQDATFSNTDNDYLNTQTGTLKLEEIKKRFPELKENYLIQLFEEFKKFDTNNDWHLDTPELLKAVPDALGKMATTDEIKEAMKEVDIDKTGTINFIKFVNVAQLAAKGEGKAPLFKKKTLKALQKTDTISSAVCVIQ